MNCIIIDDDEISRVVIEQFVKRTDYLNFLKSFGNAMDAVNYINTDPDVNLIFLDIEMPEMSGIDFLKSLKNLPQIIIISSKQNYAIEAFEYDVTDYVLKPASYPRLVKAVDKAYNRFKDQKKGAEPNDGFFIKTSTSLVRLRYEDILWVEALENYVGINTFDSKYTIHFTMKAIESKLPMNKFTRVHRSFIVNVNKISMIEDNIIVINTAKGNKSIPIGKSYRDKLMDDIDLVMK